MCYQQSLHSFKNEHASLDTHKMAATSHLNINNAFSAMVNSKLDQDLKKSLTRLHCGDESLLTWLGSCRKPALVMLTKQLAV